MNKPPIETLEGFCPPDVQVTFYLSRMLTPEQEQYVERVIGGWYDVGVHRGFGDGVLHYMDRVIFDDEQTIYLCIDMGSCPEQALGVLLRVVVDALNMYDVKVEKIELG